MAEGRPRSSITRMPRAIAPEVTMTTFSPPACSSATCAQTRSSTSLRSAPSSPATIDEPSLATTVIAPSSRVELELEVADDHLVAGLEAGTLQCGDHPDLPQPALQIVECLGVLEIVPRDQQLDPPPRHAETAIALRDYVEALLLAGAIDPVLGFELAIARGGGRCLLGQRGEDRLDQLVQPAPGRGRDAQHLRRI